MNWTGVLIEAIPELARQCEYLRINSKVYNCALVSNSFSSENITMRYAGLMSIVKDSKEKVVEDAWIDRGSMRENIQNPYEIDVPARTLTSILDEMKPKSIDLFSLDVEGYELDVLKGLDLNKYCPDYILIELHDKDAVCSHLGAEYEMCEELTPNWDYLFRRKGL